MGPASSYTGSLIYSVGSERNRNTAVQYVQLLGSYVRVQCNLQYCQEVSKPSYTVALVYT
jgi:hypothetical protein